MHGQIRTEQLLTKLVLGLSLTGEECQRVRGYLGTLLVAVEHQERQQERVLVEA